MDLLNVIIQLVSGGIGGNIAGSAIKKYSLGTLGNSIVGILGGGVGGQLLTSLLGVGTTPGGGADFGSILSNIGGGGIGGGILLILIGIVRVLLKK